MYENKFLWGVDGVIVGGRDGAGAAGGVCDLVPSYDVALRAEAGNEGSGDIMGGVACGIEPSNSSARRRELYVRFACSAVWRISLEFQLCCSE